jgi:hypothetical protein
VFGEVDLSGFRGCLAGRINYSSSSLILSKIVFIV